MKYVALLRGINVGGNSIVKMSELKEVFTKAGFSNVVSYINSGNILFETDEKDTEELTHEIDALLIKHFFAIKSVILSQKEIKQILEQKPENWVKEDLRKYIAFIKSPAKPEDVIKEAQLKEGIDFMEKGHRVVYMSTKLSGLTKSSFPKLSSKNIYQFMTIRNYNTIQKIALLFSN